jgi:hypothetical protein
MNEIACLWDFLLNRITYLWDFLGFWILHILKGALRLGCDLTMASFKNFINSLCLQIAVREPNGFAKDNEHPADNLA